MLSNKCIDKQYPKIIPSNKPTTITNQNFVASVYQLTYVSELPLKDSFSY
jgi:hypothetical protein